MKTKTKKTVLKGITWIFITLWIVTTCLKLVDVQKTRGEMLNQVFPSWMAEVLVWLIPAVSAGLAILLLNKYTWRWGLNASLLLLALFSLYIILGENNFFGRIPCSCGSILHGSYIDQLLFNLCFMVIAIIGLRLDIKCSDTPINKIGLPGRKEVNTPI